jgi:hypothetical protein
MSDILKVTKISKNRSKIVKQRRDQGEEEKQGQNRDMAFQTCKN